MKELMKIIKGLCVSTAVLMSSSLFAQTENTNQTPPYGDNPNIFKVLAYKTGSAIQNTAEKVGNATEKGIQKIKPKIDETVENTKTYTTEQATIARDNTREGIDKTVKKVEQTKDRILGKTDSNVPIEQGSLSQSSTPPSSTMNHVAPVSTPSAATETHVMAPPAQQVAPQNVQNTVQEEPEIKKQSLPIENNSIPTDSNVNKPSDDEAGIPR